MRYHLTPVRMAIIKNSTNRFRELYSVISGDLSGKEIQKRGDICIHIADSFCCTAETNTTW